MRDILFLSYSIMVASSSSCFVITYVGLAFNIEELARPALISLIIALLSAAITGLSIVIALFKKEKS